MRSSPIDDSSPSTKGLPSPLAEECRRAGEGQFRALMDTAAAAIFISRNDRFIYVNRQTEVITGFLQDELLNRPFWEFVHPEDIPLIRDRRERRLAGQDVPSRYEMRMLRKDGQARWIDFGAAVIEYEDSPAVLGTAVDITEQKAAVAALHAAREQLGLFVEHAPAAIAMFDTKMNYIAASTRWFSDYGLPGVEILGRNHYEVFPDMPERWRGVHRRCLAGAVEKHEADAWVRADGGTEWVRWEVRPWRRNDGSVGGLLMLTEIITARKLAEAALQHSTERYRSLFENMLGGYAHCQMVYEGERAVDFIYLATNPAFESLTGLKNVAGKRVTELVPGILQSNPELFEVYARVAAGRLAEKFETHVAGLGKWFAISVYSPCRNEFVAVFEDITKRKQAQEELRKLSLAVEQSPVSIVITNLRGEIEYVNPKFTEKTGYTLEEAVGQNPRILKSGEIPKEEYARMWQTISRGGQWRGEFHNRRKDGQLFWEMASISPITNEAGQITHYIAVKEDITARKKAEETLQRLNTYNRSLIEAALDPLAIIGLDGKLTDVNAATEAATGFTRDELIGKPFAALRSDPEKARADFARVLREGTLRDLENEICHRHGGLMPVLTNATVFRNDLGEALGVLTVSRDISERKKAEKALRESEARHRDLIANAVYGIWVSTVEGRVLYANSAMAKMLGYDSPSDLEQIKTVQELYLRPADRGAFVRRILADGSMIGYETDWKRRDGRNIVVSLGGRAITGPTGQVEHLETVAEEITDRRKFEDQLRQAQKMEALGQLAGGVAHDFNNLLGVILGYGEMLIAKAKPGPDLDALEEIGQATKRAAGLTRQLLAFSRKQVLQPVDLDLNILAAGVSKLLQRLLPENIKLQMNQAKELLMVRADAGQIEQVILNLAVNARDAMPQGGNLSVQTRLVTFSPGEVENRKIVKPGAYAMIAVTDNGVGMSPETQARIFDPFFTTKEMGKGTGLGLATVYGIVKQSDGFVWVYSEPGKGSTFKVYLPLIASATRSAIDPSDPAVRGGTETILVAEDVEALRKLFSNSLAPMGYRILTAKDGFAALDIAKQFEGIIDLLITDVVMPTMGGSELATLLRQQRPLLKVLYVTGYTDDALVQHGVLEPGVALMHKPFGPVDLQIKVRQILDAPKSG